MFNSVLAPEKDIYQSELEQTLPQLYRMQHIESTLSTILCVHRPNLLSDGQLFNWLGTAK